MNSDSSYSIKVLVEPFYVEEQSVPAENRFVFAYTVSIQNLGRVPAKLISRHWIITDANGKTQEVRGQGVVGEQPYLRPGEAFQYTSGAVLDTAVGTMRGTYQMVGDDGNHFDADIPVFTLSVPRTLH
ncbi:MAG: Co2+/Mg2+ efflux protein ApaG [Pseudomonadota bacterium]